MRANETRTEKILNQVSSPGDRRKVREFIEEPKRSLEVETSSVDQNEIRGKLVQRQADQVDQVDFSANLMTIGDKLKVTVITHREKLIVGTLSIKSLDRRLKLDETVIELQEGDALTSAIRSRNFYLPYKLASGVRPEFIEFTIGLEIAGQKPIEKCVTLTLGNDIDIEGKCVVIDPITLPPEFLIYDNKIQMALVQLEIDLVHDGNGYKIGGGLEAYRERIQGVFSKLPKYVEVVIFPELSIPFEFLSELQHISERRKLLIVAGSHYVTSIDGYPALGFVRTVRDADIGKSISPLITPSKRIYHSEKIFPAPKSEPNMTQGDYLNIYKFHNYNYSFMVLVCIDFEHSIPEALVNKYDLDLINVVSVNETGPTDKRYYPRFTSLAQARGSIEFTYTNVSRYNIDGKTVECGHSNVFSEQYHKKKEQDEKKEKLEMDWCDCFTKNLKGDQIRIVELNLKSGTRASTPIDYVPIFKEIDLIRLD